MTRRLPHGLSLPKTLRNCRFLAVLAAQARLRTTRNDKNLRDLTARLKPSPFKTEFGEMPDFGK